MRRHLPLVGAAANGLAPCADGQGAQLAARLVEAGLALGFARVGFAGVERFDQDAARLTEWLREGLHGEMAFMVQAERASPRALFDGAKTLIVVALACDEPPTSSSGGAGPAGPDGLIARYARGPDYHTTLRSMLARFGETLATLSGRSVLARACTDTAPLLERAAAARAGLGFVGKNALTIVPGLGSHVLLGELLVDLPLPVAATAATPRCGRCRACLDACPTGAFLGERVLDARRCISYLTIEFDGPIPRELRRAVGSRVFGCDVCQDVCPFNARSPRDVSASASKPPVLPAEAAPSPRRGGSVERGKGGPVSRAQRGPGPSVPLVELLHLTSAGYRRLVRGTALRRANRAKLARNAAVALGNAGDLAAVPELARALATHPSMLVRGHAAWALGELGGDAARAALEQARGLDDAGLRAEVAEALAVLDGQADRARR